MSAERQTGRDVWFDAKRDAGFRVIALRVLSSKSVGGLNFDEVEACLVSMLAAGDLWNRQ